MLGGVVVVVVVDYLTFQNLLKDNLFPFSLKEEEKNRTS